MGAGGPTAWVCKNSIVDDGLLELLQSPSPQTKKKRAREEELIKEAEELKKKARIREAEMEFQQRLLKEEEQAEELKKKKAELYEKFEEGKSMTFEEWNLF